MLRFLADEDVRGRTVRLLREAGRDVTWIREFARGADDATVIELARADGRILLTHDHDHGQPIFTGRVQPPIGVIFFRLDSQPGWIAASRLLELQDTLKLDFISRITVVDLTGYRQRPLP